VVGFRAGLQIIFETAHLRRSTTWTIGRLEDQSFRDRLLPLLPTKGAPSVHALAERLQLSLVVSPIDPLDPVRRPLDRTRCQQTTSAPPPCREPDATNSTIAIARHPGQVGHAAHRAQDTFERLVIRRLLEQRHARNAAIEYVKDHPSRSDPCGSWHAHTIANNSPFWRYRTCHHCAKRHGAAKSPAKHLRDTWHQQRIVRLRR
jgi:hypothetical protein